MHRFRVDPYKRDEKLVVFDRTTIHQWPYTYRLVPAVLMDGECTTLLCRENKEIDICDYIEPKDMDNPQKNKFHIQLPVGVTIVGNDSNQE